MKKNRRLARAGACAAIVGFALIFAAAMAADSGEWPYTACVLAGVLGLATFAAGVTTYNASIKKAACCADNTSKRKNKTVHIHNTTTRRRCQ